MYRGNIIQSGYEIYEKRYPSYPLDGLSTLINILHPKISSLSKISYHYEGRIGLIKLVYPRRFVFFYIEVPVPREESRWSCICI